MAEAKTHQQRQLDDVFAGDEKPNDHSLAAKSWQRALNSEKPRTMAPDEWQAYYEATGEAPKVLVSQPSLFRRWWRSVRKHLGVPQQDDRKSSKNCARSVMEDAEF
ncbi:MAG: hypothetical protein ACE37D_12295 [Pseudomonadales bacterium]